MSRSDTYDSIQKLLVEHDKMFGVMVAILKWARTPGDHGGNPYLHPFVRDAQAAYRLVTGKEYGE